MITSSDRFYATIKNGDEVLIHRYSISEIEHIDDDTISTSVYVYDDENYSKISKVLCDSASNLSLHIVFVDSIGATILNLVYPNITYSQVKLTSPLNWERESGLLTLRLIFTIDPNAVKLVGPDDVECGVINNGNSNKTH